MGRIAGIDHIAITAEDPAVTMGFYRDVLGAEVLYEQQWRDGRYPIFSLQVGGNRINVHDPIRDQALPAELVARLPTPGSVDLCFRWEGSIGEAQELLARHSIEVTVGPASREASNGVEGTSVYFNDPDGNLLELLTID